MTRFVQVPTGIADPGLYLFRADSARMAKARTIAMQGTERHKHGAVIVSGPKILAVSVNTFRNNSEQVTDPLSEASYHAEYNAFVQLKLGNIKPQSLRMYVVRVNNAGDYALSKPCNTCTRMILESGLFKTIYHS